MKAVDPVFNEPSAKPSATDDAEARKRMIGVLAVLLRMPEHGLGKGLRVSDRFYSLELAPGYTLIDWLNDQQVDRDLLNFFLALAARDPFLRPQDGPSALERLEDSEVSCHEIVHPAFLAAYTLNAPLVSFDHHDWSKPDLTAKLSRLDGEGELVHEPLTLVNFSRPGHFDYHACWFAHQKEVVDAADLWARREALFPHLVFCPSVETQLHEQDPILHQVVTRLVAMERVASSGGAFDKDSFGSKCTPTSSSTFDQFGDAYDFTTADGVTKRCGWHFHLPDGRRIYFSADYTVGHIGSHLPTTKFH